MLIWHMTGTRSGRRARHGRGHPFLGRHRSALPPGRIVRLAAAGQARRFTFGRPDAMIRARTQRRTCSSSRPLSSASCSWLVVAGPVRTAAADDEPAENEGRLQVQAHRACPSSITLPRPSWPSASAASSASGPAGTRRETRTSSVWAYASYNLAQQFSVLRQARDLPQEQQPHPEREPAVTSGRRRSSTASGTTRRRPTRSPSRRGSSPSRSASSAACWAVFSAACPVRVRAT